MTSFHNITPDRGDADGVLLVLSLVGMVAVLVVARWGLEGLAWMAIGHGFAFLAFALLVLFSGLTHGRRE